MHEEAAYFFSSNDVIVPFVQEIIDDYMGIFCPNFCELVSFLSEEAQC